MENLLTGSVQKLLIRDLNKLSSELSLYKDESLIWKLRGDIKNTAGNLCLHLCGNLQHYIGAVLGNTGYLRNRENEFALRDISREILLNEIGKTKKSIESTLPLLTESQLQSEYPTDVFGYPITTGFFLIHLSAHLGYHLGQVNYHRRLME
ncbi:MAG TPA: DinB superfamily protein [Cyclobacteriaceae bacterium]|nr:DinB superfamily protein [Cyclobacteriaceae bacterium]